MAVLPGPEPATRCRDSSCGVKEARDAPLPSHATPPDATLLASLGSGSADAISVLYDRYQALVYGAALATCGDETSAAETCLRTFLWLRHQATRLSGCPPGVIKQAIELQAVAIGRQRVADGRRSASQRSPTMEGSVPVRSHGEEGKRLPPP